MLALFSPALLVLCCCLTLPAAAFGIELPGFLPGYRLAAPEPIWDATDATITPPPSINGLGLQLAERDVAYNIPICALFCVRSALKSTTCTLGDYLCECQPQNIHVIALGSENCLYEACGGYDAVVTIFSSASVHCQSVLQGLAPGHSFASNLAPTASSASSSSTASDVFSASTASSSSQAQSLTSTRAVGPANPTDAAGLSDHTSTSSSSVSLSAGAIAGVAVGSAAGALLIGALLVLIYKCGRRNARKNKDSAPSTDQPPSPASGLDESFVPYQTTSSYPPAPTHQDMPTQPGNLAYNNVVPHSLPSTLPSHPTSQLYGSVQEPWQQPQPEYVVPGQGLIVAQSQPLSLHAQPPELTAERDPRERAGQDYNYRPPRAEMMS